MSDGKKYHIKEPKEIPFFDHDKSLVKTIKNSSNRRGVNPIFFAIRKIKNIILYQLANSCPLNSWRVKMHKGRGVHIGKNVYIGLHCVIDNAYPEYIYIEDNVSLAGEVTLIAHSNPYAHFKTILTAYVNPVVIRQGAWVGVKSAIMPGVEIGENAIVSAGSIVFDSVEANSIVRGNPAKKITNFKL